MLISILSIIRDIGWIIYAGTMFSFALLFPFVADKTKQFQTFMKLGSILGLSLGCVIFSCLLSRWIEVGHYYPQNKMEGIAFGAALMLWISNIVFEIWTLDPLRKAQNPELNLSIDTDACHTKAVRHLFFHCFLLLSAHVLFTLS